MQLPLFAVDEVIRTALQEDIHYLDTTTDLMIPADARASARFLAKAEGVVCGLDVALRVFALLDDAFEAEVYLPEGSHVSPGDLIARVKGHTRALLEGERTALNLLQHMSGIATATAKAVEKVRGTRAVITDTRKTLPGLRALQKYAVTVGGGKNHRFNLSDGAMLKDNHIDAAGGVKAAVEAAKKYAPFVRKIEVETENLDMVREAVEAGADVIMLDNMTPDEMAEAIRIIDGRAETECSGNMTKENIATITKLGVDYVSSGALTHSAPILDLSLKHLRVL